jgi:aerobic C4-dicarboxylate transport protein
VTPAPSDGRARRWGGRHLYVQVIVAAMVLLVGVDRFINEARAVTNLIGNSVATIAIARWEGELDRGRAAPII